MSWQVAWVVLLMFLMSIVSGISLLMLIPMLQIVGLDVQGGAMGRLAGLVQTAFAAVGVKPTVATVIVLYVLIVSASAALARWQSVLSASLYQAFVMKLRQRLYRAIAEADWHFFAAQRSATFTHLLTHELERVGGSAAALLSLIVKTVLAAIYLTLALLLSPPMTLLVSSCGALLSLLLLRKTRLGRHKGEALSKAYEDLYGTIGEHLSGMKITKSHGLEEQQIDSFALRADRAAQSFTDTVRNQEEVGLWLQVGSVTILATILYVALEVLGLPLATILMLILLFTRLIPILTGLQRGYHSLINLLPAFDNLMAMQRRCEAAAEAVEGQDEPLPLEQGIELEDVSFRYSSDSHTATLEHLNLVLLAGKTTAFVGPSGAGKSTLADLLVGLSVPDAGHLLVDGEPLTGAKRTAWRKGIGYVPQDIFLFHDTVRANLLLTQPGASEEELWGALSLAAADFVATLPDGLETIVGERGIRLSGGERQRLALARALLRRPQLLVLDEATSSLDAENDRWIQQAIDKLQGQMTIVIIAHRLSTVRNADQIHVLEQGRLVESGAWLDLVSRAGGRFRALCEAQGLLTKTAAGVR